MDGEGESESELPLFYYRFRSVLSSARSRSLDTVRVLFPVTRESDAAFVGFVALSLHIVDVLNTPH